MLRYVCQGLHVNPEKSEMSEGMTEELLESIKKGMHHHQQHPYTHDYDYLMP